MGCGRLLWKDALSNHLHRGSYMSAHVLLN